MLFQAGPISFLRTIVIIVGIYYLFKLFFRYIAPKLLKRYVDKKMQSFQQQQFDNQHRKEGEIHIKTNANSQKNSSIDSDLGEYVDYEEVE